MSTYIEEARRQLADWAENIDIHTFTEQYEALNHGSEGMLLEGESLTHGMDWGKRRIGVKTKSSYLSISSLVVGSNPT